MLDLKQKFYMDNQENKMINKASGERVSNNCQDLFDRMCATVSHCHHYTGCSALIAAGLKVQDKNSLQGMTDCLQKVQGWTEEGFWYF